MVSLNIKTSQTKIYNNNKIKIKIKIKITNNKINRE